MHTVRRASCHGSSIRTLLFVVCAILVAPVAKGEELEHSALQSTRAYGRGNTYVAAFDSEDATKGNPATLTEPKDLTIQFRTFPLDAFIGQNSIDTFSDLLSLFSSGLSSDGMGELMELMSTKFGKRQYAGIQGTPLSLRTKYFEFSPFIGMEFHADPRIPPLPEVGAKFDMVAGSNIAIAIPLGQSFQLGLTVRPFFRLHYLQSFELVSVIDIMGSSTASEEMQSLFEVASGTGVGVDLGTIYTVTPNFRLGMTIENVGYADYITESEKLPPPYTQKVSIGSLYRQSFGRWNWDLLVDLQNIVNPQEYHFLRLLHVGTEFGTSYATWDNDFGVTFGVNEGYLTFGTYAELYFLRLDVVNYGVELGLIPGQRQDRRWGISARILTMNF